MDGLVLNNHNMTAFVKLHNKTRDEKIQMNKKS